MERKKGESGRESEIEETSESGGCLEASGQG